MYRLFMWINNGEDVIQFPHVPSDFPLSQTVNQNETYVGLSRDYTMISPKRSVREYEWSSWWDNKDSKTMRAWFKPEQMLYKTKGILNGWQFVETLKLWMWRNLPIRMFLYNESSGSIVINLAITIEDFHVTIHKTGRYDYDIKVREYNFVTIGNENGNFDLIMADRKEVPQPLDDESTNDEFGKDLGNGLISNGFFIVINNPGVTPSGTEMKNAYPAGFVWTGTEWFDFISGGEVYANGNKYLWNKKTNSFDLLK